MEVLLAQIDEQAGKSRLTNTERLRNHLKKDSLALLLLDAWAGGGTPAAREARLLAVLHRYSAKEAAPNAPASVE